MRTLLHFNPILLADLLRTWALAALIWLAHARVGYCPICRTVMRVDDSLTLSRWGLAHDECVTYKRRSGLLDPRYRWTSRHTRIGPPGDSPSS